MRSINTASQLGRQQTSIDTTRRLIRDFDLVQRRNRAADMELWQQSEEFQESWCSDDVLVACLLANEEFVLRHGLESCAVEIVDMHIAAATQKLDAPDVRIFGNVAWLCGLWFTNNQVFHQMQMSSRMVNALGFVSDSSTQSERVSVMEKSGLVHCAMRCKDLRDSTRSHGNDDSESHTTEILFAHYDRYAGPKIQAKL